GERAPGRALCSRIRGDDAPDAPARRCRLAVGDGGRVGRDRAPDTRPRHPVPSGGGRRGPLAGRATLEADLGAAGGATRPGRRGPPGGSLRAWQAPVKPRYPSPHIAVADLGSTRIARVEVHFMKVTRRELLKGAAAIGVLGELPLALPGAAQAQTTQKKELVTAQAGDIAKFDPHFSTASQDIRVSFNLFDNLTSRHPDGQLYPGLATEWKLEGQTPWMLKLRQAVKFHNGDPFTSADAKFSLERTYDPNAKTMVATVFTTIERIEAPDPFTLVFHTKKPDPLLPARLAFYGG